MESALPPYEPHAIEFPRAASYVTPAGTIAIVGYNDMQEMLEALNTRFATAHAGFAFSLMLKGTRTAPPALASGASAFAPMGAEFAPAELAAYRQTTGGEPLSFRVAHCSLHAKALSGPLAIIVHRDNPLESLTLAQVAQVFGGRVQTWQELGLAGPWAEGELHPCGLAPATALGIFMRARTLGENAFAGNLKGYAQSADVVEAVAKDPRAIGFTAALRVTAGVKILALATTEHATPVAPTEEAIRAGLYPLDRYLLIYVRQPIDPFVREYLRFVLSREGQQTIASGTLGYLPLNVEEVLVELAKLSSGAVERR